MTVQRTSLLGVTESVYKPVKRGYVVENGAKVSGKECDAEVCESWILYSSVSQPIVAQNSKYSLSEVSLHIIAELLFLAFLFAIVVWQQLK